MKNKTKQDITILLSVAAIIISGIVGIYTIKIQDDTYKIQKDTYEAIEPFQKPIVYFHEGELKPSYSQIGNQYDVFIDYKITIKNIGKGIAQNTTVKVFGTNHDRPDEFREYKNTSLVNDIYPDMTAGVSAVLNFTESILINGSTTYVIVIKIDFEDKVTKESDSTIIWQLFKWAGKDVYHPSIEEKEKLLPFLEPFI